jgi:hypothetical protein
MSTGKGRPDQEDRPKTAPQSKIVQSPRIPSQWSCLEEHVLMLSMSVVSEYLDVHLVGRQYHSLRNEV